ncbi:MAG: hypothetical protein U0271_10510 [Polyangiaceae bacterium]
MLVIRYAIAAKLEGRSRARGAGLLLVFTLSCSEILGVEERSFHADGGQGGSGAQGSGAQGGAGAREQGGSGGEAGSADCPLLACDGVCVDPTSSVASCGSCDRACADGELCSAGTCDRKLRSSTGASGLCVRDARGLACWGATSHGDSASGEAASPEMPAVRATLFDGTPVTYAARGPGSMCALLESGEIRCVGSNEDGALGLGASGGPEDGASESACCYVTSVATPALPDEPFVDIAAGGVSWANGFFVALSAAGKAYCWGSGAPSPVMMLESVVEIAAGANFGCALDASGSVYCWGNAWGTGLANNNVCNQTPARVEGLPKVRAIGTGNITSFAIDQAGRLYGWGNNRYGQLGPGFTIGVGYYPAHPVEFDFPSPVLSVTGTHSATCALLESREVYCWGENGHQGDGRPFDGTIDPTPRKAHITDVVELGSSSIDFAALDGSGLLREWNGFTGKVEPTELALP